MDERKADSDKIVTLPINLESLIRDSFVRGHYVVLLFFDPEMVFDTTWRNGILKDLHIRIKGNTVAFIKNFLFHRTFKEQYGNITFELHDQEIGIPQGSILSVTLFIIKAINNRI